MTLKSKTKSTKTKKMKTSTLDKKAYLNEIILGYRWDKSLNTTNKIALNLLRKDCLLNESNLTAAHVPQHPSFILPAIIEFANRIGNFLILEGLNCKLSECDTTKNSNGKKLREMIKKYNFFILNERD